MVVARMGGGAVIIQDRDGRHSFEFAVLAPSGGNELVIP